MIAYPIGISGQCLVFSTGVLNHLAKHRQTHWWHAEAGGQLFARFEVPNIVVEKATGPRKSDRRSRFCYVPNRSIEQREINQLHGEGLHFIGDWHTHPESIPSPSYWDAESMRDLFNRSDHKLNGIVLAIVGRESFPLALSVWVYAGAEVIKLSQSGL
ncbi:Mov34/MPN/PAD-1 family protein [Rhodopseudomonas pseudopalustris]|uniref:Integrative and conjugative element protein, VC0181 family n=1 Tax=Rhodopseudomonas pseudopalustris TaxID=1513892 RepID=A0A1H8XAT7_9BRAD|nr:Mov34/MPN/PAD-1 family protein [Rhodopseudomonas pseudopalustris]SEP37060.1 integrative and conjugative element protein, VC0181 family [Rhodopseudomonas pseudopalustris]